MAVPYDAYRIFYYVASCGSLTAAARILHNSQPNMTRSMNQLERELGCRLLLRSNRGVTLTREGEMLYVHVREAFQHITRAETEIKNQTGLQSGQITIAASETALRGVLLPALKEYRRDFPGIRIHLRSMTTEMAIESLEHELVDIAVTTKPFHSIPGLNVEELAAFPDILIAPPGMDIPVQTSFSMEEIVSWPFISMHQKSVSYQMILEYFFSHGLMFQPATFVSSLSQIVPMVSSGLGAAFLPEFMALEQLSKGEIQKIPLTEAPPAHTVCVIFPVHKELDKPCLELIHRLQKFK